MKIKEVLKMALAGVSTNKFRSFLTLLGIIIGVGAVILMVSLGSGTQAVVSGQFSSIYTRQIYISPNYNLPMQQRGRLSLADEEYLEESTVGTEDAIPFYRLYFEVNYDDKSNETSVAGVVPGSDEVTNLEVKYGRYIEEDDVRKHQPVAVVGERFLTRLVDLADYSSMIGKEIEVDGHNLVIVGVLKQSDSTVGLSDSSVLLPLTTAHDLWRRETENVSFYLLTYDQNTLEGDIVAQVEYLFGRKYGLTSSGENRFMTEGLERQVGMVQTVVRVFTYVLGGIAAISLLVGGIGVMNIMLVSVKERTREIGIRLAIGATSRIIQQQFLLEAIMLSVGGGLIGITLGSLLSGAINLLLSNLYDWWQGNIPLEIIILSFGVTVGIGVIFGFYPAFKASRLDPIDALRYE